jgi:D-arabinose 1-dehydrogenase-like Zn-dependent alcohol dehydrogenase
VRSFGLSNSACSKAAFCSKPSRRISPAPSDGEEFLQLAPKIQVRTRPLPYPLEQANQALDDLRRGRLQGAAVLTP